MPNQPSNPETQAAPAAQILPVHPGLEAHVAEPPHGPHPAARGVPQEIRHCPGPPLPGRLKRPAGEPQPQPHPALQPEMPHVRAAPPCPRPHRAPLVRPSPGAPPVHLGRPPGSGGRLPAPALPHRRGTHPVPAFRRLADRSQAPGLRGPPPNQRHLAGAGGRVPGGSERRDGDGLHGRPPGSP